MASIIIDSGERSGDFFPLGRRTTVIGRDEAVPFQILDEKVSRRHLQIRFEEQDGQYHALDMKSSQGTYVNGRRLHDDVTLVEGDEIQIGNTRLLFTLQDFPDRESALSHWKRAGERRKTTMPE